MSAAKIRQPKSFGKRKEPPSIIITRNGKSRLYTITPWMASSVIGFFLVFTVGYLSATAYLFLRDDLITGVATRQVRLQYEYEDRIAALRANLDRVTSRQLVDQQTLHTKVADLVARQELLSARDRRLDTVLQRSRALGLGTEASSDAASEEAAVGRVPTNRSDRVDVRIQTDQPALLRGSLEVSDLGSVRAPPGAKAGATALFERGVDDPLLNVAISLDKVDARQRNALEAVRLAASGQTAKIAQAIVTLGVSVDQPIADDIGGPFEPLDAGADFTTHVEACSQSLEALERMRGVASALPIGHPLPGAEISSRYGPRIDPFHGRYAMHSGMDFKAKSGTPVRAAAAGKVAAAGRNGGYGRVVEIHHEGGMITRYAHLSRVGVSVGQSVAVGQVIGRVGSSGRSTGPHLHYEVRQGNNAVDPARFIAAGRTLADLI